MLLLRPLAIICIFETYERMLQSWKQALENATWTCESHAQEFFCACPLSISWVPLLQVSSCFRIKLTQWKKEIKLIENEPAEWQAAVQLWRIRLKTPLIWNGEPHAVRRSDWLNEKATLANHDGKAARRTERRGEPVPLLFLYLLNSKGK